MPISLVTLVILFAKVNILSSSIFFCSKIEGRQSNMKIILVVMASDLYM